MGGMSKAKYHGYAWLPMNILDLFRDIHDSVMDFRDLKYKYLTAIMYPSLNNRCP